MRTSKYEPLKRFLKERSDARIPMNFSEIEAIIGRPLPASARTHRAWWSNNPTNNVMTYAWLEAGYRTAQVDLSAERLVFERVAQEADETPAPSAPEKRQVIPPLYGMLRGTLTIPQSADLTEPAAPEWANDAEAAAFAPLRARADEMERS